MATSISPPSLAYVSPGYFYSQAAQSVLPLDIPKPATSHPASWLIALVGAIVPAAVLGSMVGAHIAGYNARQISFARKGAAAGGAVASSLLLLAVWRTKAGPTTST